MPCMFYRSPTSVQNVYMEVSTRDSETGLQQFKSATLSVANLSKPEPKPTYGVSAFLVRKATCSDIPEIQPPKYQNPISPSEGLISRARQAARLSFRCRPWPCRHLMPSPLVHRQQKMRQMWLLQCVPRIHKIISKN